MRHMASTYSIGFCTVLLSTLLIEGCRGQCEGTAKTLRAIKEWTTIHSPGRSHNNLNNKMHCQWHIQAEDDYIVHLRVLGVRAADGHLDHMFLYDGDGPSARSLGPCNDSGQEFFTTGRSMYISYVSIGQGSRTMDFTVKYRAISDISSAKNLTKTIGFVVGFFVGLAMLVLVTILSCSYLCCSARSSGPAPPPNRAKHDSRRQSIVSTDRNRPDDTEANSASQASHDGRIFTGRNRTTRPASLQGNPSPAYMDSQSLVQTAARGNRASLRPSMHSNSSSAGDRTLPTAPPFQAVWDPQGFPPVYEYDEAPPSYDAVVANDNVVGGARPEEIPLVRLPAYSSVEEL